MQPAARLCLLAIVLAVFASSASAALTYEKLSGNWTGYCVQTAVSNDDGTKAFCAPKGVQIMYPYKVRYTAPKGDVSPTFAYYQEAVRTKHLGKVYEYAAYTSAVYKMEQLVPLKPNSEAACMSFKDGTRFVAFSAKVEGNVYTEMGRYNMDNEETDTCMTKFQDPVCGVGKGIDKSYTYICYATRDV